MGSNHTKKNKHVYTMSEKDCIFFLMMGDQCFCLCTGSLSPEIAFTNAKWSSYQVDQHNVQESVLNCKTFLNILQHKTPSGVW